MWLSFWISGDLGLVTNKWFWRPFKPKECLSSLAGSRQKWLAMQRDSLVSVFLIFLGFECICRCAYFYVRMTTTRSRLECLICVDACVHKGLMCERLISIILCLVFQINSNYRQIHKYKISSSVNAVCPRHVATHWHVQHNHDMIHNHVSWNICCF